MWLHWKSYQGFIAIFYKTSEQTWFERKWRKTRETPYSAQAQHEAVWKQENPLPKSIEPDVLVDILSSYLFEGCVILFYPVFLFHFFKKNNV